MDQPDQLELQIPAEVACGPRRRRDLQREFEEWLATRDGQTVYGEARARALRLKAAGKRRYSIDAILHAIRYDEDVAERLHGDDSGVLLNDHVTSRLARLLMAREAELAGFFKTRALRGVAVE